MSEHKDDRTEAQKRTHCVLWGGTDKVLSGWGMAAGTSSFAFWACKPEHDSQVERWVRSRSDMKNVRQVGSDYRTSGKAHVHIYVVDDGHPALA